MWMEGVQTKHSSHPFFPLIGDLEKFPVCVYADYQQIAILAKEPYELFTALGGNKLLTFIFYLLHTWNQWVLLILFNHLSLNLLIPPLLNF